MAVKKVDGKLPPALAGAAKAQLQQLNLKALKHMPPAKLATMSFEEIRKWVGQGEQSV